jgi:BirA family transcriptional regulator, biotin operon repressor / biotin---[acetyl-CoA-carboxylase] ligase
VTFTIIRKEAVPSTNDAAKDLARNGAPSGTVVLAEEQTAGRGTKNRTWHSPRGLGLYVSILLKPPLEAPALLPLAAGLAAREAVERSAGISPRLRWPNDLIWEGLKLGGILCESGFSGDRLDYAVIGIGLNIDQAFDDFPEELRGRAVSLRAAAGRPIERENLLSALLVGIESWTRALGQAGGPAIAAAFAAAALHAPGEKMIIDAGAGPEDVRFMGIAPDGALLVSTPLGARRYRSADILSAT